MITNYKSNYKFAYQIYLAIVLRDSMLLPNQSFNLGFTVTSISVVVIESKEDQDL